MTDALLERIAYEPVGSYLEKPLPFTPGLEPKLVEYSASPEQALKKVDVLVVTWTSAEWSALADVLSPGRQKKEWTNYTRNWSQFEPHLTSRSPAKEAKCLGEYTYITIGDKKVALFHSQLHMCTEDATVPLIALLQQLITECQPTLFIDSGTSGGIGPNVVEGDTVVAQSLVFDCTGFLKDKPYAHESFACTYDTTGIDWTVAESLMALNYDKLSAEAPRAPKVWLADVITVDSFLFDAVGDPFGLETYDDGKALVEEMDVAVTGIVAQNLGAAMPKYTSLRSVSDPQMPKLATVEEEKQEASRIYLKYGYWAQVSTLCAVWQVIADLN